MNDNFYQDTGYMETMPNTGTGHELAPIPQTGVNPDNSTGVTVAEFVIMEAPPTLAQYARPYEFHVDSAQLSELSDAVDRNITGAVPINAHINSAGWLGVSSAPTNKIMIPNGWETKRGSFKLVLDIKIPTGVYRYEIQGYTDYMDNSTSGLLDENMRLYIDHVSSFQLRGNSAVIDGVHYLHSSSILDNNVPGEGQHTARIADINTSLTVEADMSQNFNSSYGYGNSDIVDTRSSIAGNEVQASSPNDLIISRYINTLIGTWIEEGAKSMFDPWAENSAFEDTNRSIINVRPEMIDGVKYTGACISSGTANSITLAELMRNLLISPDKITYVNSVTQPMVASSFTGINTPLGQMPSAYAGADYSADWANSDLLTVIAHTIGSQLETAVLRNGIVSIEVGGYIYSPMPDDMDVVFTNAIPATAYINVNLAMHNLKKYVLSDILLPSSYGGKIGIQFSAMVCTYSETRISVTVSTGEQTMGPVSYVLPSYAAGFTSSVVMPDNNSYNNTVQQAGQLKEVVNDVVNSTMNQTTPVQNF